MEQEKREQERQQMGGVVAGGDPNQQNMDQVKYQYSIPNQLSFSQKIPFRSPSSDSTAWTVAFSRINSRIWVKCSCPFSNNHSPSLVAN